MLTPLLTLAVMPQAFGGGILKLEVFYQKRSRSKQRLEIAKTAVERAIETDEATSS
ncbi:hypothetical protein [Leptolyngbya sp. GGD]|uniref:hypothetical protein n=1 Tax=Leptolyngbya sp. GGD TaxID=2997907 RepID=UPI00227CF3D3|nr:hypothetical protein [Leptolyngbya sp. GGD]MCY6492449.1 hypothetical protein [Leptolyngbya sp. GGD]